jgi:porphobilinogen deaminase
MPLGALASIAGDEVELTACVISPDGRRFVRATRRAHRDNAARLGALVAGELKDGGAGEILALGSRS